VAEKHTECRPTHATFTDFDNCDANFVRIASQKVPLRAFISDKRPSHGYPNDKVY